MNGTEYQKLAMRTNDNLNVSRLTDKINTYYYDGLGVADPGDLLNGALGLTGEAGEVVDIIKKHIFHGHALYIDELVKELGDVLWYVALISEAIGKSLDTIMEVNIEKLKNRYPEGFSESASINRTE